MAFNKNIILVPALCILLFSFSAEARWLTHIIKHVSYPNRRIKSLNAPSPSPLPSHISSSPTISPSADALSPKSSSTFVSLALKSVLPSIASTPNFESFISSPGPSPSQLTFNVNSEVQRLCEETDDASSCLSSIQSFLNGHVDPFTLLRDGVEAAMEHVKLVIAKTQENAHDNSIPPFATKCLIGCLDNFDNAMENLHESMKAIENHDMGKLSSVLDAALDDVTTCSDSFKEHPEAKSALGEAHEALYHQIKNCLIMREAIKLSPLN